VRHSLKDRTVQPIMLVQRLSTASKESPVL
jgi:hypothetical protein